MEKIAKTFIEFPTEEFQQIKEGNLKILTALESLGALKPTEYLSSEEFRQHTKTGKTWLFDRIKSGQIKTIKRARKWLIPSTELQRFYKGEII